MTNEQREQILHALRHGREANDDMELETIIREDLADLEPLINGFLAQAALAAVQMEGFANIIARLDKIEQHLWEKFGEAP